MHGTSRSKTWARLASITALLAGALVLAGCATGYAFVQPEAAGSGGYYTGDEPYTGQGYYDVYGTGPYYPGTSGWGYYNGSFPFAFNFGYYGGYFGNYGYWSPWIFNFGVSSVWDFPGYWGPWYSIDIPIFGCDWHCRHRDHHWRDDHHRHGQGDTAIAEPSPHRWRNFDHPHVNSRGLNGAPAVAERAWAARRVAPRPLAPASFASRRFVRAPIRQEGRENFVGQRALPAYGTSADHRGFATNRMIPMPSVTAMPRDFQAPPPAFRSAGATMRESAMMPRGFRGSPQPAFRSAAPAHFSAPAAAPARSSRSNSTSPSRIR